MSQTAELLHFDPNGLLTALMKEGKMSEENRHASLKKIQTVADARLPHTVHVPKNRRKRYQLDNEIYTHCDNNDGGCSKRVTGADVVIKCDRCGRGVYCSEACREQDAGRHRTACQNTASDAVSHVYDDLVSFLDEYYEGHSKLLNKGLKRFQYFRPLSSRTAKDATTNRRLANIELWMSLVIFKEVMSEQLQTKTLGDSDALLCMTCSKPTTLDANAAASIVVMMNDYRDDDRDKEERSLEGANQLGDVPDLIKVEFLGVEANTMVHGRFYVCCDEECYEKHNSLLNPYGTFDLWKSVLAGMVKLHIEYMG